jgi:hypothetical protein
MANYTDGNDAAFARPGTNQSGGEYGLTKREYFAGQIMASLMSDCEHKAWSKTAAEMAVFAADALIEELNKQKAA